MKGFVDLVKYGTTVDEDMRGYWVMRGMNLGLAQKTLLMSTTAGSIAGSCSG